MYARLQVREVDDYLPIHHYFDLRDDVRLVDVDDLRRWMRWQKMDSV